MKNTLRVIKQFSHTLLKAFDSVIDYLARHPLLDKLESAIKNTGPVLRASIHQLEQKPYYQKAALYAQLVRLDKPIGILLLLWPTLIALWIAAEGFPDPLVLFVFVAGVILMRSAGCAINDYADRHIDGKVKRTKLRPLAAGKITEKEALLVFASLSISAFLLVLLMNTLTIWMAFVHAMGAAYVARYVPSARLTYPKSQVQATIENDVRDLSWP